MVISLISDKQAAIEALCQEFKVERLEVFGSASTGPWNSETSDVDFLVTYSPDWHHGGWMTSHYVLQGRLSDVLGRPVDLVLARQAFKSPVFDDAVQASRRIVYER